LSIIDALTKLGHTPVVLTNEYDLKLYPTLRDKEIFCAEGNILKGKPGGKLVDAVNATALLIKRAGRLDGLFLTGMYFASKPVKVTSNAKVILYVHAPVCIDWTLNPTIRKISKRAEGRLYRSADYVLSNSGLTRNSLKEHLKLDSEILYPPVDTDFFLSSDKRDSNIIVSVCRLHPKKKSELMIRFFRELEGGYKFILAGALEESFEEYKRLLMKEASLDDRVSVIFNPGDDQIRNLLREASVFWYIYSREEFGLPVAEAMSCGVPVVAFQGGGMNEIVANGQTGFLVTSKEEFLSKTALLLDDLNMRCQMGIDARRRVEEAFSCHTFTSKMETVLNRVFTGHDSVSDSAGAC